MLVGSCCNVFVVAMTARLALVIVDQGGAMFLLLPLLPRPCVGCGAPPCPGVKAATEDKGGSTGGLNGGVNGSVNGIEDFSMPSLRGGNGGCGGGGADEESGVRRSGDELRGGKVSEFGVRSWLRRIARGLDDSVFGDWWLGWGKGEWEGLKDDPDVWSEGRCLEWELNDVASVFRGGRGGWDWKVVWGLGRDKWSMASIAPFSPVFIAGCEGE